MSEPLTKIYVIAHDGGCEGWSGPMLGFLTVDEAQTAAALEGSLRVFEVPMWPHIVPKAWYDVDPLPVAVK